MAIIHLPIEFKEFLQSLNSKKVEYLLVGGYPVSYYGYARATADIDVWIRVEKRNAGRLSKALVEYGFDARNVRPELVPAGIASYLTMCWLLDVAKTRQRLNHCLLIVRKALVH